MTGYCSRCGNTDCICDAEFEPEYRASESVLGTMIPTDRYRILLEAEAERDALRGAGADERAEAAIMSHAEAYRLVEEARQMREERDALAAELAACRAALAQRVLRRTVDGWLACDLCRGSRRLAGEEVALNMLLNGYPHTHDCLLAAEPGTRGAKIVEAAERVREHRDALLAAITEGNACRLCDGFGEDDDQIAHTEDCATRQVVVGRALVADRWSARGAAGTEQRP